MSQRYIESSGSDSFHPNRKFTTSRRQILRAMLALPAAGAVAIALGACGKSDDGHTIKMTEQMTFAPNQLTIRVGETVTWHNDSAMVHSVTTDPALVRDPSLVEVPAGAETWHSGNLEKGDRFEHSFESPGTYRYICIPHEVVGMTGTVIVEV